MTSLQHLSYAPDGGAPGTGFADGAGRARPQHKRPVTDYGAPATRWMLLRQMAWRGTAAENLQPNSAYTPDLLPPRAYAENAAVALPMKHIHASLNKIKHAINVVKWTPEGRRLLTGSSSGEFTLWNGMGFNFETIMQAHDCAIRACEYSHGADWLLSGDHDGIVKYWQPNFNNVKILEAHKEAIRDLSFSPSDAKFVTASDDGTLKIWNFNEGEEERTLTGHGWDVKCVDWHPSKGLIVSGSKDHLVKLWDPRVGRCLSTLHGHKNTVSKCLFQPTRGDLLATCARDQLCRVVDLRMMKDFCTLKGYEKDISTLTWHPINPALLSAGGSDGSVNHYLLNQSSQNSGSTKIMQPSASIPYAHEYTIWAMDYHPLGHLLCTGSNDRVTRFWGRPRPGESEAFKDRFHLGEAAGESTNPYDRGRSRNYKDEEMDGEDYVDALVDQKMPIFGQQNMTDFSDNQNMPGLNIVPQGQPVPGLGLTGLGNPTSSFADFLQNVTLPPPPPPVLGFSGVPDQAMLQNIISQQHQPQHQLQHGTPFFNPERQQQLGLGLPPLPPLPLPSILPPGFVPPGMQFGQIPGILPPIGIPGFGNFDNNDQNQSAGRAGRRGGPLPSQQDSLQAAGIVPNKRY